MSGLIDLLIASRILAGPILVGLFALFFYHMLAYSEARKWKRKAQSAILAVQEAQEVITSMRNENQRINSKLNSAKKRIRRQRRKTRRKQNEH